MLSYKKLQGKEGYIMKLIELTEAQYKELYQKFPEANFMQMYEWGQVMQQTRKQTPIYIGLIDDTNTCIAGALLLKKKLFLQMSYFYSPRGFLIDFTDTELVATFTKHLKTYMKQQHAIYLKVDPEIIYHDIDHKGQPIKDGHHNYDIYQSLLDLGYHHKGFNVLFEHNQPRYTFRRYFSKYHSISEMEKSLSKSFLSTVKRSYKYKQEVVEGMDPSLFYELAQETAKKDNFTTFSKQFYATFFKQFHTIKKAKIFNVVIYPDEILETRKKEINELKNKMEKQQLSRKAASDAPDVIKRMEKDIRTFAPYENQYPDGYVVASLMCSYSKQGMYTLYLGNNDLALYTFSINRLYYEVMIDCYNRGIAFMDLFGTIGDPQKQYQNLADLHEYKRKFGDQYTEFIGEFDLIYKPFWYRILPHLLKIYRKFH